MLMLLPLVALFCFIQSENEQVILLFCCCFVFSLVVADHEHDGNELQVTQGFQTHVAKKLGLILDR